MAAMEHIQRKTGPPAASASARADRPHRWRSDFDGAPGYAPAIVGDALRAPGQPLDASTRAYFEPRLGHHFAGVSVHPPPPTAPPVSQPHDPGEQEADDHAAALLSSTPTADPPAGFDLSAVRVHTDPRAAASAQELHALAYAVGPHIVFAPAQYDPTSMTGRRLLAHELIHAAQQAQGRAGGRILQRKIDPADLPKKKPSEIMADDTYIDNNITKVEFFAAEEAIVHYSDGSQLSLGLLPDNLKAPFEGIDYRTTSGEVMSVGPVDPDTGVASEAPGTYKFVPRPRGIKAPSGTSIQDALSPFTETATFTQDVASGRSVPTLINSRTAPMLCRLLRDSEAKYSEFMDEVSKGGVKIFTLFQIVLEIAGALQGATEVAAAGAARNTVLAASMAAQRRARSLLASEIASLLKSGASKEIEVEGVKFFGVRVTQEGAEVVVTRFGIRNESFLSGQGRLIHAAYEQAAMQAAKQAGAKSVRVMAQTVVNAKWRMYLTSLGYGPELIPGLGGVFTKTFPL